MGRGWRAIDKKDTVEDTLSIDLMELQKKGLFEKPGLWTTTWSWCGEVRAKVSFMLERDEGKPSAIRFIYTITNRETGEDKKYDYPVYLDSTPCHFGGVRYWFLCPIIKNGVKCTRRTRKLYLTAYHQYVGCRECYELSYDSRQMSGNRYYEALGKEGRRALKQEGKYR